MYMSIRERATHIGYHFKTEDYYATMFAAFPCAYLLYENYTGKRKFYSCSVLHLIHHSIQAKLKDSHEDSINLFFSSVQTFPWLQGIMD